MFCPKCGGNLGQSDHSCRLCGMHVLQWGGHVALYCPQCGKRSSGPEAKYCSGCATQLVNWEAMFLSGWSNHENSPTRAVCAAQSIPHNSGSSAPPERSAQKTFAREWNITLIASLASVIVFGQTGWWFVWIAVGQKVANFIYKPKGFYWSGAIISTLAWSIFSTVLSTIQAPLTERYLSAILASSIIFGFFWGTAWLAAMGYQWILSQTTSGLRR